MKDLLVQYLPYLLALILISHTVWAQDRWQTIDGGGDLKLVTPTTQSDVRSSVTLGQWDSATSLSATEGSLSGSGGFWAIAQVNGSTLDFGDAPDSYATRLNADGARHRISSSLRIGTWVDSEPDGAPTLSANGDDNSKNSDESGLAYGVILDVLPGDLFSVSLSVNNRTGRAAIACGWIDFNINGQFDNTTSSLNNNAERVCAENIESSTSSQSIELVFTIPSDFVPWGGADNQYLSRFRLTTDPAFADAPFPFGEASDGEVEDHAIRADALFSDRFRSVP